MSRIDELIAERCPKGVEYLALGEVASIAGRNVQPSAMGDALVRVFSLPAYDRRDGPEVTIGSEVGSAKSLLTEPCVLVAKLNPHIPRVWLINTIADKSYCSPEFYPVVPHPSRLDLGYVYHFVRSRMSWLAGIVTGSTNSHKRLQREDVLGLRIPVPPLAVQREIAAILEKMEELQAELQAELQTRQQQYTHYRDALLNFPESETVRWATLSDICLSVSSGGTPSTSRPDFYGGDIPWLRTQEVDYGTVRSTGMSITDAGLAGSSAKWIPANCVIVAMYGATAAKVAINGIPLATNQACCNLEIDPDQASSRYVFHWLSNEYVRLRALGEGSQSNLNAQKVKNYPIAVPPRAEQDRIVDILDRFDALTNDLSTGLPAEIEARRKQYEYYRDRLLTFEEKLA